MKQLVIAVLALVAACTPPRGTDAPLPPVDPTRLSHEHHVQIPCSACHRSEARPGKDDHRPCDDGACHRKEFLGAPGLFCRVCHADVTTSPLRAPLKPFPVEAPWRSEPSRFSHKRHMDAARMESRVGFHVSCADCHTRNGKRMQPDHATCSRCHANEAALPGAPSMEDCAACHQATMHERKRARLIGAELRFDHDRHVADRRGKPIRCDECHTQSASSTSYDDHAPPRVRELRELPRRQQAHAERAAHAGVRDLPPRAQGWPHRDRAAQSPARDGAATRSHARVPARPRRGRRARRVAVRDLSHADVGQPPAGVRRVPPDDAAVGSPDHVARATTTGPRRRSIAIAARAVTWSSSAPRAIASGRARTAFLARSRPSTDGSARINVRACLTCHDRGHLRAVSRCHAGRRRAAEHRARDAVRRALAILALASATAAADPRLAIDARAAAAPPADARARCPGHAAGLRAPDADADAGRAADPDQRE